MLLKERVKNQALSLKVEESLQDIQVKETKISNLKKELRQMSDALRSEKAKSRLTILKLVDDVEDAIAESIDLKGNADQKMSAAELAVMKEREKAQNAIKKERQYTSYAIASRESYLYYYFLIYVQSIVSNLIDCYYNSETKTKTRTATKGANISYLLANCNRTSRNQDQQV